MEKSNKISIDNICNVHDKCGGCIFQGIDYDTQLSQKDRDFHKLLDKHDIDDSVYRGIIPAPSCFGYRNKMEYTFGDEEKGGALQLGMHLKGRFMSIITTDKCQLVPEDFNKIQSATLEFCKDRAYTFFHRKTHEGLLRNLVLRCGINTKELLINIVTSSQVEFDEQAYKEMLLSLDLDMKIVGILHTFNDSAADAVINQGVKLLFGRDYYNEEILSLKFKVKAFSFFQTNIRAVERLYSDALYFIPEIDGKIVYDLYCGTGTISQLMSSKAMEVYGIDIVEDSIQSAVANTELNNIGNCHYICGDVHETLSKIDVKPDVIVVDPPRVGMHNKAVDYVASYGIKEILYISCNPKTLFLNIERFREQGYDVVTMQAYDNFPMTKHVESVVLMTRVAPTK